MLVDQHNYSGSIVQSASTLGCRTEDQVNVAVDVLRSSGTKLRSFIQFDNYIVFRTASRKDPCLSDQLGEQPALPRHAPRLRCDPDATLRSLRCHPVSMIKGSPDEAVIGKDA